MLGEDLKAIKRAVEWAERCSPEGRRYLSDLLINRVQRDNDETLARLNKEVGE